MRQELTDLRKKMKELGVDAYLIPTTDFHGSEYVNNYFKCREYISGFTGSAGDLVVTADEARLWTDGRYFLQAAAQLKDSGVQLMKMGQPGVPTINEYLESTMKSGEVLGFDGRIVFADDGCELEELLSAKGVSFKFDVDLAGDIWKDRPAIKPGKIYPLPIEVTGRTTADKIADMRTQMKNEGADWNLMSSLEEIAWLFNLRSTDVENNPVFFSFALVSMDKVVLYVYDGALDPALVGGLAEIKSYFEIFDDLKKLPADGTIIVNGMEASFSLLRAIPEGMKVINEPGPAQLLKSLKNDSEIKSTRHAHVKDGVAMVNFLYWLKNNIGKTKITEISASDYLEGCRRAQDGWFDLSFPTIAGYNAHGAIIHYEATPETDVELKPEGFLLLDSGAHYNDGTTDITRTIALGPLNDKMKEYYTAVLKCHIKLAATVFKPGTKGIEIDREVRKPLQALGLDYNHGTGHGVGHLLAVHEWPNNISPRMGEAPILPRMITSNEPGVYIENEFGVRLENEILCNERPDGDYEFETITFCPFEREAIAVEQLTADERKWLNEYHKSVFAAVGPYVSDSVRDWLESQTKEI